MHKKLFYMFASLALSFLGSWATFKFEEEYWSTKIIKWFDFLVSQFTNHRLENISIDATQGLSATIFFGFLVCAIVFGMKVILATEKEISYRYSRLIAIITTTIAVCLLPCGILSFFII